MSHVSQISPTKKIYLRGDAFALILTSLRGTDALHLQVKQYAPLNPGDCIPAQWDCGWLMYFNLEWPQLFWYYPENNGR
jgi:hypothetical protein